LNARVSVNSRFPMEAAVQETLGAVLRRHRDELPRGLWNAACMKCMLVAAAAIDRLQHVVHASAKEQAAKAVPDGTGNTQTKAGQNVDRGAAASAAAEGKGVGDARVTSSGLSWGMLDAAMLATIQLRLRTYHQVLHESVSQVLSHPRSYVFSFQTLFDRMLVLRPCSHVCHHAHATCYRISGQPFLVPAHHTSFQHPDRAGLFASSKPSGELRLF
jgi:hypothetical protein